jgi:hypothetical protein
VEYAYVTDSYAIGVIVEPQEATIASFVWHSKKLLKGWYKLYTLAE